MKKNIDKKGRWIRFALATLSLAAGILILPDSEWLAILLILSAIFIYFEAFRGWCVLRACGVKTRF